MGHMQQLASGESLSHKLQSKGVRALSDFELLELIVHSYDSRAEASFIARHILKLLRSGTDTVRHETLMTIKGMEPALATAIVACTEVTRRFALAEAAPLSTQADLVARLDEIRNQQQEHLVCLSLDGGQRLIAKRTITIGTLDTVIAHPREIFADAIADRAACIVLAHNHPSGSVKPSPQDITLTQQLVASGQLLGIPLRDHIIVSKSEHFSFSQHHML